MDIKDLFMNICMDLWSGDCAITYELFIKTLNEYIDNLKSHLGDAAHEQLESLGVIDNTGMSWAEQDAITKLQIQGYDKLLRYLEDDHNWTI